MFVSNFNEMAFSAIDNYSFSSAPDVLLIYGQEGLGKTTLLNFLYDKLSGKKKVIMTNGPAFSSAYVAAVQGHSLDSFRHYMRSAELLLVDDLHRLTNKKHTIEELLYTYESILKGRGKMALTVHGEKADLDFLGERFASRLHNGLTLPLYAPTAEEMKSFTAVYLRQKYLQVEQRVIDVLAEHVFSFAEMKSRISQFTSFAEAQGSSLSYACFQTYEEMRRERAKKLLTPENITRTAAETMGVEMKDLMGESRKAKFVQTRQLAMYIMRSMGNFTLKEIGDFFGQTHGAVCNACKKIEKLTAEDRVFNEKFHKICNQYK